MRISVSYKAVASRTNGNPDVKTLISVDQAILECGYWLPSGLDLSDSIAQRLTNQGWDVDSIKIDSINFLSKRLKLKT